MSGTEVEWVVDSVIRLPGSPGVAREGAGIRPQRRGPQTYWEPPEYDDLHHHTDGGDRSMAVHPPAEPPTKGNRVILAVLALAIIGALVAAAMAAAG